MKLNFKFLNKGTIWWVVGAIVLFVIFYMVASGGNSAGASDGTTAVVGSTPSDAQIAAQLQGQSIQAQLAAATIQAQSEVTVAAMQRDVALANVQAGADITKYQVATDLQAAREAAEYGVETANIAANTQLKLKETDAALLIHQMNVNAEMFNTQSQNLIAQSLIGASASLKKKDRDNYLVSIATGAPYRGQTGTGTTGLIQ